jgi:hypothetical protein
MPQKEYPEHDKLRAIKDQSQAIGSFLEFGLGKLGLHLCSIHNHSEGCGDVVERVYDREIRECGLGEDEYVPTHKRITSLLAEHFDINEDKLEAEKRSMLEEVRG